jgi:hypothetical protein
MIVAYRTMGVYVVDWLILFLLISESDLIARRSRPLGVGF